MTTPRASRRRSSSNAATRCFAQEISGSARLRSRVISASRPSRTTSCSSSVSRTVA
ncbi:hypothetical protein ACFQX7_17575 [Luedemannella flava]